MHPNRPAHQGLGASPLLRTMFAGLMVALSGCSIIPLGISKNQPLPESLKPVFQATSTSEQDVRCGIAHPQKTSSDKNSEDYWSRGRKISRARLITAGDLKNELFVGLALSGGGSRAANFSAAVLFELEKLGILPDHVTAISSVSGGSLTAGYYSLNLHDRSQWNPETVYDTLGTNFENWALATWFISPMYFPLTLATAYDRSNIMADVFDRWLYENKTFQDLNDNGPLVLINASLLSSRGCSFLFTQESFNNLGSEINTYPLSHAVMASAAFPGFFNSITLTNHFEVANKIPALRYRHMYDGGPSDNLGIDALLDGYNEQKNNVLKGCLLIVVDAYTNDRQDLHKGEKFDSRGFSDFFFDSNAMFAADTLLTKARANQLQDLGIWRPGQTTFTSSGIERAKGCAIWHLTLEHLIVLENGLKPHRHPSSKGNEKPLLSFAERVNQIPTRLKIENNQQEDLITAGQQLIYRDQVEASSTLHWHQPYWFIRELQKLESKQTPATKTLLTLIDPAVRDSLSRLNPEQRLTPYDLAPLMERIQTILKEGDLATEPEFSNLPGAEGILASWASPSHPGKANEEKMLKNLRLLQIAFPEAFTHQDGLVEVCKWFTKNQVELKGCQILKEKELS